MKNYFDNCIQKFRYSKALLLGFIFILFSFTAFAQPHEYIFNNNLNEYSGGPSLTEILACGASAGSYGLQTAGTTSGACLTSNSFCFNDGGGVQYPNGLVTNSYTIQLLFRFNSLGGYARIIDFSNSGADAGIYFLGNCLNLYPNGNVGPCPYFTTNTYYLISFVRDGNTNIISVYVDGTLFGTYNDSGNIYRPASAATPINFFRDDNPVPCEAQPGCVKYISVSPTIASQSDVTQTWNNITTIIHATPAIPPTVTATAPGNLICANTTVSLSATGSGTITWNGGSLSNAANPATVSAPGTYIARTVDANGCMDTAMVSVASNTTPPSVTAVSSGNIGCSATSVTLTGTSAGNSMVWNGGSLSNAANPATVSAAGTYTVTAISATNGCTNTATATVINDNSQQLTISVNSPTICNGQTATLTATGAVSYVWSTGATTNPLSVSPTSLASYTVIGTSGSCVDTAIATVTVNSVPVVAVNSATICNGQTAVLTASGAGTFTWSTGAVINPLSVSPVSNTSYTVTGTTAGCSTNAVATVTVNNMPSVNVNSDTICNGQTTTLTATGAAAYTWSTGALTNPISVSPVSNASYTVTGTTAGCSDTAVATVDVNNIPAVTVNSSTICSGQTATLTANGAASYAWSTGATTNPLSVSPVSNAFYTVTGTTAGCSNTAVASVTLSTSLLITVNSPTICTGQTATLTANGADTYSWSTGSTNNPLTVSPSASVTSYTVTGTTNSCMGTAVATVTVNNPPVVTANSVTICAGSTASLTANGGTSYVWSTGATTATINDAPVSPSTYTVIGTTAGCSDTATASVAITPLPVITVNSATICQSDTVLLTANGGSGYTWSTGATTGSISVNPATSTPYTVTGTLSGCTNTATASVTVNPLPAITVASTSICNGGTGTITASGATSYLWSTGATGSQLTASPVSTATYTVTGTALGCSDTATGTITVNPFLAVNLGAAASICPGSSATLTATAQFGSSGPYLYSWAPSITGTGATVTVSPTITTTYTVTVNDGCSPPATDTVTITVLHSPTVTFTADTTSGCAPLCVNFTNTSSVTGGTLTAQTWDFGADQPTTQNCFAYPGLFSVTLTVTSNSGCSASYTDTNMITVVAFPIAGFSAPPITGIIEPIVNFTDYSTGASQWIWWFGDSLSAPIDNSSILQSPSHTYSDTGNYCVTLIAGNAYGCYDTTISCLLIETDFTCYIPNSFTPDDNDINDTFNCVAQNISEFEMQIYDRWGTQFFYTDDINKGWDGTSLTGDILAKTDIYIYKIQLKDNRNKKHKYLGTVMLIR